MTEPFLGVETSFTGRRWIGRAVDERLAEALAQRHQIPDILARALAARGVGLEEAPSFLAPRLRDLMPDPSSFKDMDQAVARFVAAVQKDEKIAVFGDYDVDGATSSALLVRFGRALQKDLRLYIPDRLREGYGPNGSALRNLAEEGVKLVVCVDCGTLAHEALAEGQKAGLDVIVLDHHTAEPSLPPAVAVVNPNRLDETMTERFGALAAVGVTYLFAVAVNRELRDCGFFAEIPEPDLMQLLDLVALGTICDVVPLTGLNRAFVAQGLKIMGAGGNAGLVALGTAAGAKGPPDTYTAGFILGPRLNAGGRIGISDWGAKLLATDDPAQIAELSATLNRINVDRQEIEGEVLASAEARLVDTGAPLLFIAGENWHAGVIGIVASRLREKYHRPAIVIGVEKGIGKGSGRSMDGVDLGSAVIAAKQAGLLIAGGGHKMAAGLTVAAEKMAALREFLIARIGAQMEAEPLKPSLTLDGIVAAPALNGDFMEKLSTLQPFGTGNPEPRFALPDCRIVNAKIVGEKHVSIVAKQGGDRVRGIAFRAMDTALGPALLAAGEKVHLAGKIRPDDWRGNGAVQLIVEDAGG